MKTEKLLEETLTEGFGFYRKQFISLIVASIIAAFGSVFIITAPPLFFGLYVMSLKVIKGEDVEFTDVFSGFDYFLTSWALTLVAVVAVTLGLLFLIVPGIALYVLFTYAIAYAVIDNKGAVDALKKSFTVAWENPLYTLVLVIILSVVNSAGSATALGWFVTYPYTVLATCLAAEKLVKSSA